MLRKRALKRILQRKYPRYHRRDPLKGFLKLNLYVMDILRCGRDFGLAYGDAPRNLCAPFEVAVVGVARFYFCLLRRAQTKRGKEGGK